MDSVEQSSVQNCYAYNHYYKHHVNLNTRLYYMPVVVDIELIAVVEEYVPE